MARLEAWAENTLKVVDEKGDSTARVRLLTSDGSCWQTWDAPFGDVDEWCQKAETLISELVEEFSGEVQFVFCAESASGTVRGQLPRRAQGRRQAAKGVGGALFGGAGTPAGALQAMYDAQAKTVEKTLQSANVQLEVLTRTVETQARAHAELLDYVRTKHETEAMEQQASSKVQEMLGQMFEQAPLLFELLKAKSEGKKLAKSTVAEAVKENVGAVLTEAAVTATTNGAQAVVGALTGKG
jgi:hypothetical protein